MTKNAPAPAHFLLVEDDAAHAELVKLSLNDSRVANTLDWVSDGEEAIRFLKQESPYANAARPDIVLLDLRLPKIDGHEVLQFIKSTPSLSSIPVVILTTSSAEVDRARAYSLHANSYVVKPVDFERFHQLVRDLGLYWSVWNSPPPGQR